MTIVVQPLTEARWADLEAIFQAKGCSMARGCWCMYCRQSGKQHLPPDEAPGDVRRAQLRALADRDPPAGLIGYRGDTPVGWISLGPRGDFPRLRRSPVMKPVDDQPVWSVVCFVVPSEYRHQGVATALLKGAIAFARRRGVTLLEAYPVDKPSPVEDQWLWYGAKSMYDKAGFHEVARRRPERPVMRLRLAPADTPSRAPA